MLFESARIEPQVLFLYKKQMSRCVCVCVCVLTCTDKGIPTTPTMVSRTVLSILQQDKHSIPACWVLLTYFLMSSRALKNRTTRSTALSGNLPPNRRFLLVKKALQHKMKESVGGILWFESAEKAKLQCPCCIAHAQGKTRTNKEGHLWWHYSVGKVHHCLGMTRKPVSQWSWDSVFALSSFSFHVWQLIMRE